MQSRTIRRFALQSLAALAVGAAGYASLGTTDCTIGYEAKVEVVVELAADETERVVEARFTSSVPPTVSVYADPDVQLTAIDPQEYPPGMGGRSSDYASSASGAGGSAGATVESPAAGATFDQPMSYHQPALQYLGLEAGPSTLTFRVERGAFAGPLSVPILVVLEGGSCDGPPGLDLRVDVVD